MKYACLLAWVIRHGMSRVIMYGQDMMSYADMLCYAYLHELRLERFLDCQNRTDVGADVGGEGSGGPPPELLQG